VSQEARSRCIVIVPCYNEGARLRIDTFLEFLNDHAGIEFLFVNDGSHDDTIEVLEAMERRGGGRIHLLDKKENGGKAEAVREGMLAALHSGVGFVGFWDADLATPLEAITDFLTLLEHNPKLQMVFGARVLLLGRHVHRRAIRHYLGRVFASVVSITLRLPIYDTQCGAKLFRATLELDEILRQPFLSRWVFDVEILARFIRHHQGGTDYLRQSLYELPLHRWDDVAGSKVKPGDFFKASLDLLRIYRRYIALAARRTDAYPASAFRKGRREDLSTAIKSAGGYVHSKAQGTEKARPVL
jgi:dolichyl-phosphate beta-glucosyltransferase